MIVVSGQLSLVGNNTGAKLMSGKIFVWLLATVLLTTAPPAEAQQPKKVHRIGFLAPGDPASQSTEAIRLALRELGYIEGQNITIEYGYSERKRDRFPELAAELVPLKVDIIVAAGGDLLVRPIKNATKTIPIVMGGRPKEQGEARQLDFIQERALGLGPHAVIRLSLP